MSYLKAVLFHTTYSNKPTPLNAMTSTLHFPEQRAKYAHLFQDRGSTEKLDSWNPLCQGCKVTLT